MRRAVVAALVICLLAVGVTAAPAAALNEQLVMNAGGPAYSGPAGSFDADTARSGPVPGYISGQARVYNESQWASTSDPAMLSTMRQANVFRYVLPNIAPGDYQITLHFSEPAGVAVGGRVFDVTADDILVLDDLDVFAESGRRGHLVKEFVHTAIDNRIILKFTASSRAATVSGVEIRPYVEPCIVVTPPTNPDHGLVQVLPTVSSPPLFVGASSYRTFDLTNSSAAPQTVDSITSSHADFMVLDPWVFPFTLDPGETQTVMSRFRPLTYATMAATLTTASSCASIDAVSLTGTGDDLGVSEFPDPRYDSMWVPRTAPNQADGIAAGNSIGENAIGVIIGQSITRHTAGRLLGDPVTYPTDFTFVDLSEIGADSDIWAEQFAIWNRGVDEVIADGHAVTDVEVAFLSLVLGGIGDDPNLDQFYGYFQTIIDRLPTYFPNVKQIYVSSTHFGGFSVRPLDGWQKNGEPMRWAGALVVERVVEEREGQSPWVGWGPYTWANETPRGDGIAWTSNLFQSDGVHLNLTGQHQDAQMWYDFFMGDATSPWYELPPP